MFGAISLGPDQTRIESVRREFTKRLPGYGSLDYTSRLTRLHADSLELRRLRHDLIYAYIKVVFGLVNVAGDDLFTLTSLIHSNGTRGKLEIRSVEHIHVHNDRAVLIMV